MTCTLSLLALTILILPGCAGSGAAPGELDPNPLKVALLPDESPSTVRRSRQLFMLQAQNITPP